MPAKSLMRFKCVSKIWSCLIRSRYFTNLYLSVASPPRPPRLYMSLVDHRESTSSMEVCHNPRESVLLSLSSSSSNNAEPLDPDLTMPGMGRHNTVVLHGLILYNVCKKACIYNPATRQSLTLSAVKSNIYSQEASRKNVCFFFGHDPVLDQYKVVCADVIRSEDYERITSEHWVSVLEAGGSWKKIEFDQPHVPTIIGLCINGVTHYLASTSTSRGIVVSIDVRSLEYNVIQVLPSVSGTGKFTGFIKYGGKPAILDHTHLVTMGLVDLWVLEDDGRWSTKSLVLQPCQMHLVDNDISFIVQGTTQNGEVILAPFHLISPYHIFYYDLQKNDLRKVRVRGILDHWFGKLDKLFTTFQFYFTIKDKSESIMHFGNLNPILLVVLLSTICF